MGSDGAVAAGLAGAFLLLYLRTLCPTVYLGDSGEICTAIATGGVIHPPGYPLFSLLGRAALVLIPVGEPAFQIGCVVAAAAAGAVATLYALARALGCSRGAAAAGAALFGVSHSFWNQSTRVEVYSLHVLLAGLVLLGALQYRRTGSLRALAATALAGSLGLAHHPTIALLVPAAAVLCGRRLWQEPGVGRRIAWVLAVLPAGPLLYLLLLHWARSGAIQSWGLPINGALLWEHASARFYHGNLRLPGGSDLWAGLQRAGSLFTDNFPGLLFLFPLVGIWALWRRDRAAAGGLSAAVAAIVAYNLCYRIDDLAPYYLAAWLVAAAALAVAVDALGRSLLRAARRPMLGVGLVAAALVGLLLRNGSACDLHCAVWVREFACQKLENTDPGGVLITQSDADTFPIWYAHDVLGVRPDVLPIDRAMAMGTWLNYDRDPSLWYLHRLRCQGVPVAVAPRPGGKAWLRLGQDGFLIGLLECELRHRPLCTTFAATSVPASRDHRVFFEWVTEGYQMVPQGIVLRCVPKGRPMDLAELLRINERMWARVALPDLRGVRTDQDLDPAYVVHHYATMLVNFGGLYEMAGKRDRAEAVYRRAEELEPDCAPAAAALASLRRGQTEAPLCRALGQRPPGD